MEFKETKIATLSEGDIQLSEQLAEMQDKLSEDKARMQSLNLLFQRHLVTEYGLKVEKEYFTRGCDIYESGIEE